MTTATTNFNILPPNDFRVDAFSFNEENQTWYFLELEYVLEDKVQAGYFKDQTKTDRPLIFFNIVKTYECYFDKSDEKLRSPKPYSGCRGYKYYRKLKNNKFKFNKNLYTLNRGALTPD